MRHLQRALATAGLLASVAAVGRAAPPSETDDASLARLGGGGKLLLTGGVSSIDGAAGGGLTPWAVTASHAASGEIGATAHLSRLRTQDYDFTAYGTAVTVSDRVELSVARQRFEAGAAVPGAVLHQDIVGLKWRVAGDAVLEADRALPQIALGLQYKRTRPGADVGAVLDSVQARRHGVDVYISATKLLLEHGVLINGTLRGTRANQNGLLGFGAAGHQRYRWKPEVSVAWLVRREIALGAELRAKPDNLAFAGEAFREDAWKDVFIAWAPNKQVALTLAHVDLGRIVGRPRQSGTYVSLQLAI